jgi:deazaflavin-dependent oxidoreductase (nitroreductase family)
MTVALADVRVAPQRRRSVEAELFRTVNRIIEPRVRAGWGSPGIVPGGLVVLETRGRKSGRRSRIPLAAMRIKDHVVVSTFRGDRSQWVKNVEADPRVRYWSNGRPRDARAIVLSSRSRDADTKRLPAPLGMLRRVLLPYTCAGWAFAFLVPEDV